MARREENMKKSDASRGPSASDLISKRIAGIGDWRGDTLGRVRALIRDAVPDVVEEWKWMGSPAWSRDGLIAVGNAHKDKVKLTFAHGADLPDPDKLFNAGFDGKVWRAIDLFEGDTIDERAFRTLVRAAVKYNQAELKNRPPARTRTKGRTGRKR
jgi:hypothetical protein